jgi:hypothetical protein
LVIPIAGSVAGELGTYWRTDLNLINHRNTPQRLTIAFNDADWFTYGPDTSLEVVVPPLSTTTYVDVVESLLRVRGMGVIYINTGFDGSPVDANADIDATYRIWTKQPGGMGTSSQSSVALDLSALTASHEARTIIGLRQDADFRCSVGVVNIGYYGRAFRVTATSPSGSVTTTFTVPGYSVTQMPLPYANLGYMTIVVEPLDGVNVTWATFASSVDNYSGDSWLMNAMTVTVKPPAAQTP